MFALNMCVLRCWRKSIPRIPRRLPSSGPVMSSVTTTARRSPHAPKTFSASSKLAVPNTSQPPLRADSRMTSRTASSCKKKRIVFLVLVATDHLRGYCDTTYALRQESADKHGIAKGEETITMADSLLVCGQDMLAAGESGNEHEEC